MMCVSQCQTGPILNPIELPYNPHAPHAKGGPDGRPPHATAQPSRNPGAADLRDLAPRIAAPTLVICGSEESDAFKDAARWLGEYIAGARVEFVDQGAHASVLEQPVVIEKLLREFLA
jgi:pimeloyl-ACP methyl ester carboxylesterase